MYVRTINVTVNLNLRGREKIALDVDNLVGRGSRR